MERRGTEDEKWKSRAPTQSVGWVSVKLGDNRVQHVIYLSYIPWIIHCALMCSAAWNEAHSQGWLSDLSECLGLDVEGRQWADSPEHRLISKESSKQEGQILREDT